MERGPRSLVRGCVSCGVRRGYSFMGLVSEISAASSDRARLQWPWHAARRRSSGSGTSLPSLASRSRSSCCGRTRLSGPAASGQTKACRRGLGLSVGRQTTTVRDRSDGAHGATTRGSGGGAGGCGLSRATREAAGDQGPAVRTPGGRAGRQDGLLEGREALGLRAEGVMADLGFNGPLWLPC